MTSPSRPDELTGLVVIPLLIGFMIVMGIAVWTFSQIANEVPPATPPCASECVSGNPS